MLLQRTDDKRSEGGAKSTTLALCLGTKVGSCANWSLPASQTSFWTLSGVSLSVTPSAGGVVSLAMYCWGPQFTWAMSQIRAVDDSFESGFPILSNAVFLAKNIHHATKQATPTQHLLTHVFVLHGSRHRQQHSKLTFWHLYNSMRQTDTTLHLDFAQGCLTSPVSLLAAR